MPALPDARISRLAEPFVDAMGDIFWDYQELRDEPQGYAEPRQIDVEAGAAG